MKTARHPRRSRTVDETNQPSAGDYPLARWYLRPAAAQLARWLSPTWVRPWHLTLCGLALALAAAGVLFAGPSATVGAGVLVLGAWFFDRAEGQLARHQGSASRFGAWLDANVDELVDIGLHTATAAAAAAWTSSAWPWGLLIAFLAGKYLFMHGLASEQCGADEIGPVPDCEPRGWLRRAYHLPANADVRIHLLAAALLTGWLTAELAVIAVYYNARWLARYPLVAGRLKGAS